MSNEIPTAAVQTTENNSGAVQTRNQGNRNNSARRFNSRSALASPINFEGETSEVGVVIGLRIEKFYKKAGYQFFAEKIGN